jgi:hypothetical protein
VNDAGSPIGVFTLYDTTNCTGGGQQSLYGTCQSVSVGAVYSSYNWFAGPEARCAAGTSMPEGGVAFDQPITVCCP